MSQDHGGGDVVNVRLNAMREDIHEIRDSQKAMEGEVKSVVREVTKLSAMEKVHGEQHNEQTLAFNRAFKRLEDHDERLKLVEVKMPLFTLVSSWVFKVVIGLVSMLGALAFAVLIKGGGFQ